MWQVWGRQNPRVKWQRACVGHFKYCLLFAIECELDPYFWEETIIVPKGENPNGTDYRGQVPRM